MAISDASAMDQFVGILLRLQNLKKCSRLADITIRTQGELCLKCPMNRKINHKPSTPTKHCNGKSFKPGVQSLIWAKNCHRTLRSY